MAARLGSVISLLSGERGALLTRGASYTVEPKRYVRGLRRNPVKVLFPEGTTAKTPRQPPRKEPTCVGPGADASSGKGAGRSLPASGVAPPPAPRLPGDPSVTRDQVEGLRFERAVPGDKRLARVVSVARSRTFREHQGKILLEGKRLICDALEAGVSPQMLFFSTVERLRELPLDKLKRATLVKVKFEEIKIWSNLVAPQGVIAIFSRPEPSRLSFPQTGQSVPLSLICDNIRDPGNLGTILRSAAAAGCHDVLLTKGCVDAWEPKVLRAAMGAHFRLPIYSSLDWGDIESHLPEPVTVHVADNFTGPGSVMEETEAKTSSKPSKARDYGWVSARGVHKNLGYEEYDRDSDSDSEDAALSLPFVDVKLYHEIWAQNPTAVVIGGETHGLSVESVQLAEKTAGKRLYVPLVPGVDSLNSAMAASIILFEGRRQMLNLSGTSERKGKYLVRGQRK